MTLADKVSGGNTVPFKKVRLAGFDFDNLTEQEVIDHIINESQAGRGGWVLTPNIDICRKASRDPELIAQLRETSLTVADGMPLLWAAKANGTPIVARVTGSSLIFTLSQAAAAAGRSVYLLGGVEGIPELAGQKLANLYPGLKVAGSNAPPFAFEESAEAMGQIKATVHSAAPDIVYVGLGFPKQEKLIIELRKVLPTAWYIGCGAAIPIVAGSVPRAPEWMQRVGLEWMHRLLREPRRLFRRYIIEDFPFAIGLLVQINFMEQASRRQESRLGNLPTLKVRRCLMRSADSMNTPVRLPGVTGSRPMITSVRMTYRLLRHIITSTRSGYLDYTRQGIESLSRMPLLMAQELSGSKIHECNICGWTGANFFPNTGAGFHERDSICPGCMCQDRHRSLLALVIKTTSLFAPGTRVVEVAPMRGFEALLMAQPELDYTSFDLERHAMEHGDITAMRFPTSSVDYFIGFHVLEHIPDEHAALAEIHRILKPGAVAILQVPVDWDVPVTREYAGPDPRDVGHVRRHGADFPERVGAAGFDVVGRSVTHVYDSALVTRFGMSLEPIFFATKC